MRVYQVQHPEILDETSTVDFVKVDGVFRVWTARVVNGLEEPAVPHDRVQTVTRDPAFWKQCASAWSNCNSSESTPWQRPALFAAS